jgi:hypothetical protein
MEVFINLAIIVIAIALIQKTKWDWLDKLSERLF